jgi:SAM-dependent methyltransferase
MESLPFRSESVDIVFSNGAICLSPDKESIFREAFRVLKSGGQLVVVDLVFAGETRGLSPTEMPRVGPGVPLMGESHYLETVRQAGFEDIEIVAKSAWGPEGQKDRILATIKATKPKP